MPSGRPGGSENIYRQDLPGCDRLFQRSVSRGKEAEAQLMTRQNSHQTMSTYLAIMILLIGPIASAQRIYPWGDEATGENIALSRHFSALT